MIGLRQARRSFFGGLMAVLLATAVGCTQLLPGSEITVTKTGENNAPPVARADTGSDEAIGLREHPRIIASFGGIYSDRPAEIMLARIVSRLLTAANQPNTQFTITILDSSEVNAFALPGGYVYVTRGILALANDSSELAAVLAHEMAHVILKHARARTNRARTDAIVDRVITGVLGDQRGAVAEEQARISMAAFSQKQELDADHEGIILAGKAGFDPYAAARFLGVMGRFAKFSAGESSQGQDFLASHPSTPDRIQKAIETARQVFGPEGIGTKDRDTYMAGIDGMAFGPSQQQGAVIGRRFVHPGARFTFTVPDGYTLQNSQGAVVGVAGDGEAVRFDSANVPANVSLVDYLRSGWIAGLDAASVRPASYNGIDMATGTAHTDQWSFRVSVMRLDGTVYRFIFAAKSDSARFARGAENTLESFRRASSGDLGQIRKVVIDTVKARPGDTAAGLAQRMAGLTRGVDLFYVLNNLLPGDPLVPGQTYKIVALD